MLGTQPLVFFWLLLFYLFIAQITFLDLAMHSVLVVTEIIKPCFHFTFFLRFVFSKTRHLKWKTSKPVCLIWYAICK